MRNHNGKRVCQSVIVHLGYDDELVCTKQHQLHELMSKGIVMEKYDDANRFFPDPYYQPEYCLCVVDILETAKLNDFDVTPSPDPTVWHLYKRTTK
jgi:hypothetical protein